MNQQAEVTQLLELASAGDRAAFDRLLPLVYDELRQIARRQLRREFREHTLLTTGLVHEAYLKLVGQAAVDWQGRAHFYGVAARAMRQVLVDYARRRQAGKRGGDWQRVSLTRNQIGFEVPMADLLALDRALDELDEVDSRLRQVVEYRFFAGMTEIEIGEILGLNPRTVRRDWVKARAWLYRRLYADENAKAE